MQNSVICILTNKDIKVKILTNRCFKVGVTELEIVVMDKNNEYNPDIVSLTDEDGNEYTFELLDRMEIDGVGYAAMLPVFDDPQALLDDDGQLAVFKIVEEDGEECFDEIADDDEYDMVADAFVNRLQDYFDIDED